ncbi:type II toxin-antitoxin system death-on-curing family toxin [Paenibacillus pini]|uniref:Death on curing protein n=1 Tax=Paenibacillus pini JCM 16418 TaxID=1236976 RepID=W7Z2X5_9BACL|nr:type II toxin-antitoxin system death-on-curing family toxin [Paenibacillus pini]GAF08804.1 death on curing protein [Paenibacillus pini JCM 16418]
MKNITIEQLVIFHGKIVKSTGGADGVRDRGLLESALNKSKVTFDGRELYEGLYRKIAVTGYALIKNHGFVDGNKRIGVATLLLLLRINNIKVRYEQSELVELGLRTAEGIYKEEDVEQWIIEHQV